MISPRASVRRRLWQWMTVGAVVVLLLSLGVAVEVAQRMAHTAYDQALYAVAVDIGSAMTSHGEDWRLTLSTQSERFVRTDEVDTLYYCVRDENGQILAGDRDLPVQDMASRDHPVSHTIHVHERTVQAMSLPVKHGDEVFVVTVAETTHKRSRLFQNIAAGLVLPAVLLLFLTSLAVWWAVRQGLRPLTVLEREIAQRSPRDLSAIDDGRIPQEAADLGRALNRLLGQVREAGERQRRFVADAAHQLRTPLAGIQVETELLRHLDRTPGSAEDRAAHLERLSASVNRMVRLTQQLLALARSEPTEDSARPAATVDLAQVVQRGANDWVHDALRRGIDLGFDLRPAPVSGDAGQLLEMLNCLVDNALKYTPATGEVTVLTGGDHDGAFVRVCDNGPGVAPDERDRIFERFHRGRATVGVDGVGLGLSIVKEVADAHGATVTVSDAAGGGAVFTVRFPA